MPGEQRRKAKTGGIAKPGELGNSAVDEVPDVDVSETFRRSGNFGVDSVPEDVRKERGDALKELGGLLRGNLAGIPVLDEQTAETILSTAAGIAFPYFVKLVKMVKDYIEERGSNRPRPATLNFDTFLMIGDELIALLDDYASVVRLGKNSPELDKKFGKSIRGYAETLAKEAKEVLMALEMMHASIDQRELKLQVQLVCQAKTLADEILEDKGKYNVVIVKNFRETECGLKEVRKTIEVEKTKQHKELKRDTTDPAYG